MESIKRVERFQHEFDDLFERFGFARRRLFKEEQSTSIRPPIESYVEGDDYKIRVELPGVDPKDVDIRVAGGVLTIKGSSDEKYETRKRDFFRREFHHGSFERASTLADGVKANDLKAAYHHGVLELAMRMSKEALPNKVKVHIQNAEVKKPEWR